MEKVLGCKIDAWSGIWRACSIDHVVQYLHIYDETKGFFKDALPIIGEYVYGQFVRFVYNYIMFEIPLHEYMKISGEPEILTKNCFSTIKVAMQGKGLDYLREIGVDIDNALRVQEPELHITRVDFAFDFVNYDKDLLYALDRFVHRRPRLTENGRLSVKGVKGGISFTQHKGATENTFYFGSSSADRLVRIYDKYLERSVANNGLFADTSYGDPSEVRNWIRIEWQLRNKYAQQILYAASADESGFKSVLREIFDFYKILNCETGKPFEAWEDFFNPDNISALNYTKFDFCFKTKAQKNDEYIERVLDQILLFVLRRRESTLMLKLRRRLEELQTENNDEILESLRQLQFFKLTKALCECSPTGELSGIVEIENNKIKYPTAL